MTYRRRFLIGDVIRGPRGWRASHWIIDAHGDDYISPLGKHRSRECLRHVPTGIIGKIAVTALRRGHCPALKLNSDKRFAAICYSVRGHYTSIHNPSAARHKTYKNLPFQKEWSPKQGGSFLQAAWEIYQDIGEKPGLNYNLSIVIHKKGFVRGNLCWTTASANWLEAVLRRAKKSGETKEKALFLVESVWGDRV